MAKYKIKCGRCKKNYVLATWKTRFPVCFPCQEKEMQGEIEDPEMKKMFDIPLDFYKESNFLRDIKIKYLRYGNLTDKQIDAFVKTVKEMTEREKEAVKEDKKEK